MWREKKERKTCWQQERAIGNAVMAAPQRWQQDTQEPWSSPAKLGGQGQRPVIAP